MQSKPCWANDPRAASILKRDLTVRRHVTCNHLEPLVPNPHEIVSHFAKTWHWPINLHDLRCPQDPTWLISMEQASFYTCLHMFCSLQSIVLAPPKFRKLRSMSKCPDSQNITTESVGKCSAFKRCDPAQSCTWWTCLAINPASKIEDLCFIEWVVPAFLMDIVVHCDSIKLEFWTFPVQQHYHFFNEFFHNVCWSLLSKPSGDSHQCQQPRLYRPRSFGIMLYTSWK